MWATAAIYVYADYPTAYFFQNETQKVCQQEHPNGGGPQALLDV
jgi:hypothetical protein